VPEAEAEEPPGVIVAGFVPAAWGTQSPEIACQVSAHDGGMPMPAEKHIQQDVPGCHLPLAEQSDLLEGRQVGLGMGGKHFEKPGRARFGWSDSGNIQFFHLWPYSIRSSQALETSPAPLPVPERPAS